MILKDLLDPTQTYQVTLHSQLGEGAQGQVFRLKGLANDTSEYVLKLYHASASSHQGKHLAGFAKYIYKQQRLKGSNSLALPLRVVVDESQDRIGYTMRLVPGQPLDGTHYHDLYTHPTGMKARLQVALALAESVAELHRCLIISADIAESNLHLDMKSLFIFHTDLDGGGVLVSSLENRFHPGLSPLVRGHMEGSSMAPELFQNENNIASLASDRWSLAVMIHKLLCAGLDPYFAQSTYQEILDHKTQWPILQASDSTRQKYIPFHLEELQRISLLIRQHLSAVFNRTDHEWHPELRPKADDWVRDLRIGLEWVKTCQYCHQEFIAEGLQICPFCNRGFWPSMVWTQRICVPIDRQGKSLLGRDLGFKDHQGRYVVAVFGRRDGKLFILPQVPLFDPDQNQQYNPSQSIFLDSRRRALTFQARSSDGNQKAEFRVRIN